MKRVIFNQKGGVGKTSIACNLAAAFAKLGRRVLLIDLDAQANASQYVMGSHLQEDIKNVADFFESTLSFKIFQDSLQEAVHKTAFKNLWLVPAHRNLADIQSKLESRYKILKLSQALESLIERRQFDEVIIDTPPALNVYTMSALLAVDRVLIPYDCDAFSARAVLQVIDTVEEVANDYKPDIELEGIIINHFQAQAKIPQEAVQGLLSSGLPVLKPYLSSSVFMKESHNLSTPLVFLKAQHKLSKEYLALAQSLLDKEETAICVKNKAKDLSIHP